LALSALSRAFSDLGRACGGANPKRDNLWILKSVAICFRINHCIFPRLNPKELGVHRLFRICAKPEGEIIRKEIIYGF